MVEELIVRDDNIIHSQVSDIDFSHLKKSVGEITIEFELLKREENTGRNLYGVKEFKWPH